MNKQELKQQLDNEIANVIITQPTIPYREIGKLFGVSDWYVCEVAKSRKIRRPQGMASPAWKRKAV
jgi:hypothetical protein